MSITVGIIGSRNLACELTSWMADQKSATIIGGVPPPYSGWWNDDFRSTLESLNIPVCNEFSELLELKPDIIFSINYWKTISVDDINSIKMGIVNIHHSYMLKYKGRFSTSWAILNARKYNNWTHGSTLHFIDQNLDEGKIIDSWSCPIYEDDTAEKLFIRVEKLAIEMFKYNFNRILEGDIVYLKPIEETFFYGKESQDLEVNLNMNIEEIYDHVRAWSFKNRPKPFITYGDKKIYLSLEE
jgi:methionyl-tRNA formyltransferase